MRRSSTQEPLRVLLDNNKQHENGSNRKKSVSRSSSGNRLSFGRSASQSRASTSGMGASKQRTSSTSRASISRPGPSRGGTNVSNSRPSLQSRQSLFGLSNMTRASRLSRGSGIGTRTNNVMKDTRPLSDKGYQHKCVKQILQFLTEQSYPHNITPKILQSPTMKDFLKIFEFIYSLLDGKYKVGPKPEEEIPKILRQIGYPFLISKTSMFAIGSPHTWPHMLAALCFLVDFINYGIGVSSELDRFLYPPGEEDEFDSISDNQLFAEYTERAYCRFLDGDDCYEDENEILEILTKSQVGGGSGSIEDLMEENTRLEMELEMLEKDGDRLKAADNELQAKQVDEEALCRYIVELEDYKRQVEKEYNSADEQYSNAVTEFEAEKARLLKMQQIFETQEFTADDVERIKISQKELRQQVEEIEKRSQNTDQEIWKEEMGLTNDMDQMRKKCETYNSVASKLKLIPIDAECSNGIDFEMRPSYNSYRGQEFSKTIKPALLAMKVKVTKSVSDKEYGTIACREQLESVTEHVTDLENEISLKESKYKRTEEEVECTKEMQKVQHKEVQDEIDELQSRLIRLRNMPKLTDEQMKRELEEIDRWFEHEMAGIRKESKKNTDFLQTVIHEVLNHIELTEGMCKGLKDHGERMLARTIKFKEQFSNEVDLEKTIAIL